MVSIASDVCLLYVLVACAHPVGVRQTSPMPAACGVCSKNDVYTKQRICSKKKVTPSRKESFVTLTQESTLGGSLDGRSMRSNDTSFAIVLASCSQVRAIRCEAGQSRGSLCSEWRFFWSSCARKGRTLFLWEVGGGCLH
jgi:hypothetical protein